MKKQAKELKELVENEKEMRKIMPDNEVVMSYKGSEGQIKQTKIKTQLYTFFFVQIADSKYSD